jgi:hypothetical protein
VLIRTGKKGTYTKWKKTLFNETQQDVAQYKGDEYDQYWCDLRWMPSSRRLLGSHPEHEMQNHLKEPSPSVNSSLMFIVAHVRMPQA